MDIYGSFLLIVHQGNYRIQNYSINLNFKLQNHFYTQTFNPEAFS